jgi:hypothetical protein
LKEAEAWLLRRVFLPERLDDDDDDDAACEESAAEDDADAIE